MLREQDTFIRKFQNRQPPQPFNDDLLMMSDRPTYRSGGSKHLEREKASTQCSNNYLLEKRRATYSYNQPSFRQGQLQQGGKMAQILEKREKNKDVIKSRLQAREEDFQNRLEQAQIKREKENIKLGTDEIFQVISDINDKQQIAQAMKFIKDKKQRLQLIDRIIKRQKEKSKEQEQSKYHQLRHILGYVKRKFLKRIGFQRRSSELISHQNSLQFRLKERKITQSFEKIMYSKNSPQKETTERTNNRKATLQPSSPPRKMSMNKQSQSMRNIDNPLVNKVSSTKLHKANSKIEEYERANQVCLFRNSKLYSNIARPVNHVMQKLKQRIDEKYLESKKNEGPRIKLGQSNRSIKQSKSYQLKSIPLPPPSS